MDKVTDILNAARQLSHEERHRLLLELDALEIREPSAAEHARGPYAALRALSGKVHSDFTDISTDKYPHAGAAADSDR